MVGYLREMISNWLEIMDNMIKKKNEMLHDEIPSYALSKILLVVVQNLVILRVSHRYVIPVCGSLRFYASPQSFQ